MLFLLIGYQAMADDNEKNVLGGQLAPHSGKYVTGFYRDGFCRSGAGDVGQHAIAAIVTKEFLEFTKSRGNDLETPRPEYGFAGLKPGDNWCLCTARWKEAEVAGVAPPVRLEATHATALSLVPLETLKKYQTPTSK
jgi:uncharacterized protein (DUF2237 family)